MTAYRVVSSDVSTLKVAEDQGDFQLSLVGHDEENGGVCRYGLYGVVISTPFGQHPYHVLAASPEAAISQARCAFDRYVMVDQDAYPDNLIRVTVQRIPVMLRGWSAIQF